MQDKIARVLKLLNMVVLDHLEGSLGPEGDSLSGALDLQRLALKADGADGLLFEELRLGLQDVILPGKEDKSLAVTLRVDRLVLSISPEFWARAAAFARERIIASAGEAIDRVIVEGQQIRVEVAPDKKIAVELLIEKVQVLRGERVAQQVENLHLRLEDFYKGPDMKASLAASRVYLYSLSVQVSESFLNDVVGVVRSKIPPMVQDVTFDLSSGSMLIVARVKLGPLPMTGRVELQFRTNRNNFGIKFLKITGLPMAGRLVPWFTGMLASKLPEGIEAGGDNVWINPWSKIPIPISTKVTQFGVGNNQIRLEFAAPDEAPRPHLGPDAEPALPPTPVLVTPTGTPTLPPLL